LSRVALAGHSAGGHLALWLAAQGAIELRGVVALAAVSDLRRAWELRLSNGVVGEFLGAAPDYARASPIEMLPMATPQRLVHGTADDIVPFELSERFAKASANAVLVRLEGVGHRELIEPAAGCWPVVMKQLMEVAGDEGGGR
jgi:dipeptidyl aminopeptidase/acylaminoacyl peptidase